MSESRLRGKIRRITDALEADPVDVQTLKELAISADGLITVDLRCKVWTKLLNVNAFESSRHHEKKKGWYTLKLMYQQASPTCKVIPIKRLFSHHLSNLTPLKLELKSKQSTCY